MKMKWIAYLGTVIAVFSISALCADINWIELNDKMIQLFKTGQSKKALDTGNRYVEQIRSDFFASKMVSADAVTFLVNQGFISKQVKEYKAARDILNLAVDCKAKIASPNDPLFVGIYKTLGDINLELKEFKTGEECYKKALKVKEINLGADHADLVPLYLGFAGFYQGFEKNDLASGTFQKALQISKVKNGEEHVKTADVYYRVGEFYFNQKKNNEAEKAFLRAFSIYDKNKEFKKVALAYDGLGLLNKTTGNLKNAESYFRLSLKLKERSPGKNSIEYANSLNNLGTIYFMQKNNKEAEVIFKESLNICEQIFGKDNPALIPVLNNLAEFYSKNSNEAEAQIYKDRIKELNPAA